MMTSRLVPVCIALLLGITLACDGPSNAQSQEETETEANESTTDQQQSDANKTSENEKKLISLVDNKDKLLADFNQYDDRKRLLMILSPT